MEAEQDLYTIKIKVITCVHTQLQQRCSYLVTPVILETRVIITYFHYE